MQDGLGASYEVVANETSNRSSSSLSLGRSLQLVRMVHLLALSSSGGRFRTSVVAACTCASVPSLQFSPRQAPNRHCSQRHVLSGSFIIVLLIGQKLFPT